MGSRVDVMITGMGLISPAGVGVAAFREAILAGRSGVRNIEAFRSDDLPVRIAGLVRDLDPLLVLTPEEVPHANRATQLILTAAREALGAPGERPFPDATRVAVTVGACSGGMEVMTRELAAFGQGNLDGMAKESLPQLMDNSGASWISLKYGIRGPSYCFATACATSMDCLGLGYDLIQAGRADAVIAGGGDAAVTRFAISAFANARALSRNNDQPALASRPFDKDRDGFVMGEAAVVFLLERADHAKRRGAPVLARLCGYGTSNDAHHLTSPRPDGSGLAAAMGLALEQANIRPNQVGYVSAHATSTELGDVAEAAAVRNSLGAHTDNIHVGATKSLLGHTLGAAGGVSSMAAILAVGEGILTPCVSFKTPDPECNIPVLASTMTGAKVDYAIANAAGFGGQNSALVFGAP